MDSSSEEARQTLEHLEERLRRDVADMLTVLEADIPKHIIRTARAVFERWSGADALDDAAIKKLKQDTQATSKALTDEVLTGLRDFETWTWDSSWAHPVEPEDLEPHPRVSEALARVEPGLLGLLERHGVPAAELGDRGKYRVPAYFVAGHFMKSLVANYWRALLDHHQLSEKLQEADQAEERQTRRDRWDSV